MTVYNQMKGLSLKEMAVLLGSFADTVCNNCDKPTCHRHRDSINQDYTGCPINEAGYCGWPQLGCDESAVLWLMSEDILEVNTDQRGYLDDMIERRILSEQ